MCVKIDILCVMITLHLVILIDGSAIQLQTSQSTSTTEEPGIVRLPKTLVPTHYEVRLHPFLGGNFSIHGDVKVDISVLINTPHIIMHLLDIITLNNTAKVVEKDTGIEHNIIQQTYSVSRNLYIIHLEKELSQGHNYTFSVSFIGTLNEHPKGFYRSSYIKENGEKIWVASTQLQATDARRAFPCFDEPNLKATYKVFLARQHHMTALSNMPLIASIPMVDNGDWIWDEFMLSVPMSTYLVAFVITDFPHTIISTQHSNTTLLRVWTRSAVQHQAALPSRLIPKYLDFFTNYFNVPFPLPKTDIIANPENSFNAMENWGLITFRESGLLYDPVLSTGERKRWVSYLTAHEIAHQWFGNLVTLSWWTDLWLNEGFATYMGYKAINQVEPSWKMLEIFVVLEQQSVMALDSLRSSHPVSVTIHDSATINQIFDEISYSKGAAIIRMMNHFLTESTYRRGLTNYLTTLQYDIASQNDLWDFMTQAGHNEGTLPTNMTVKTIMDTWTLKMGFPVITVTRTSNTTAKVTQQYFSLDTDDTSSNTSSNTASSSSSVWWVPLTYTTEHNIDFIDTKVKLWLKGTDDAGTTIHISYPQPNCWVIFNIQQCGYYRVNYDEDNWLLLSQQLQRNHSLIHVLNRAQIFDDAFNLARTGRLSYKIAFSLMDYLEKETEYVVWKAVLENLNYLYIMMNTDSSYGALKNYLLSLLHPIYGKLGGLDGGVNMNTTLPNQLLWSLVVDWMCKLNHQDCLIPAQTMYQDWISQPNKIKGISGNIVGVVSCIGVREGGELEWVFAWTHRQRLNDALGCTRHIWLINRYLDGAFNASSGIRREAASSAFSSVAKEPLGSVVAWQYLKVHWQHISQYIGTAFFALPKIIESVTNAFNTQQQLRELEEFEKQHSTGGGLGTAGDTVTQALEQTRINIDWIQQHRQEIIDILDDKGFNSNLAKLGVMMM